MSEDAFTSVVDTNLTGAYRVAKRAVRPMMRLRRGRIIFISSVVGLLGSGGQANYAASKAGLVGMARSLARELGSRNITVNVVAPGFADTDMTAELGEDRKKAILAGVPLGRIASADEVAGVVQFLAGPTPPTSPAPSSRSTAASAWATDPHSMNHDPAREGARWDYSTASGFSSPEC